MRKNMKLMVIICILAILIIGSFGTLAYLTDTAGVTNTFTVGKVEISMDETKVDAEGNPVDKNGNPTNDPAEYVKTTEGNQYKLIPGAEYLKDPAIKVIAGSEKSYVRTILTVTNYSILDELLKKYDITDYATMINWDASSVWKYIGYHIDTEADTISFEFRYFADNSAVVDASTSEEDLPLPALFTKIKVPGQFTAEDIAALQNDPNKTDDDIKVIVEGHAIQVVGFEDAKNADGSLKKSAEDAAWEAFSGQETSAAKGATVR